MVSCQYSRQSSGEETPLLNAPINSVELKVLNEIFTVDFRIDTICRYIINNDILPNEFAKLKTRGDLINYYKTLFPHFLPGYSSMSDNTECLFVKIEYMLAQECFSDRCDSKFRKEVLQLVTNYQKAKYGEYICPSCAQKSGIFLMAVILVKERNSTVNIIDSATLQQALLCLNNEVFVDEDFSNLIVECSEKFLTNNK